MINFWDKAPQRTTPSKNKLHEKYDINYVREKAKNSWEDIWDDLQIPSDHFQGRCPLCRENKTFQVTDEATGTFHCAHCKANGDGFRLLELYHHWTSDEVLEMVGRNLRIRYKGLVDE